VHGSFETVRPKKIAVVGSGISGLSAAWLLSKRHHVTLYEEDGRLGGHTNTVEVMTDGGSIPVDTGFIVYNEVNYPNLVAFFDHLDVETVETDMSFSVSIGNGAFEYAGSDLNGLFAQRRNILRPRFYRMIHDIRRFYREAPRLLAGEADGPSLADYLTAGRYSDIFIQDHLIPMGAAIWSTPADRMLDYPAGSFVRFCENHGLLRLKDRPMWRTVVGGAREYVRRIHAGLSGPAHIGKGVRAIRREQSMVLIRDDEGRIEFFDDVVIATHADTALRLLGDPDQRERSVLGAFSYQPNRAVLHSDPSLMPRRKAAWASWNYLAPSDGDDNLSVTYWMNRLQPIDRCHPLFVTLNPHAGPAPDRVIAEVDYTHPIFDSATAAAQRKLWSLQGRRHTWFCGAYFGWGFHEDGLQSGLAVAEDLGGLRRPWAVDGESGRIHRTPVAPDRRVEAA